MEANTFDPEVSLEQCQAFADEVLLQAGRMPDRDGVFVAVVVLSRRGGVSSMATSCVLPSELERLSTVLGALAGGTRDAAADDSADDRASSI